ncbi:hypothetical protein DL93DRAFT_2073947 [Clavulina sp. PMI_390]|nr:hypothetical protein DL93DRAFT_2073947 [Clavulina sp. PMI_390]
MTAPVTTDCACSHRIRCNTQLNALVPHTQYLSSVPIDVRLDPLQSQSRAIYPDLRRKQQSQHQRSASPLPPSPRLPQMVNHASLLSATAQEPRASLSPQLPGPYMKSPPHAARVMDTRSRVPPTGTTPGTPTDSDWNQLKTPTPNTRPRRPSMARPKDSKVNQHLGISRSNSFAPSPDGATQSTDHLVPPSDTTNDRHSVLETQTLLPRKQSSSHLVRPTDSKANKHATSAKVLATPHSSHRSATSSIQDVLDYYSTINPRYQEVQAAYPGIDVERHFDHFQGDARISAFTAVVQSLQHLPSEESLRTEEFALYHQRKMDVDRLFQDVHTSCAAILEDINTVTTDYSTKDARPRPNRTASLASSSASRKQVSFDARRQSNASWESDSTNQDVYGQSSSLSTKGDDFPSLRGRPASPYPEYQQGLQDSVADADADAESSTISPRPFVQDHQTMLSQPYHPSRLEALRNTKSRDFSADSDAGVEPVFLFPKDDEDTRHHTPLHRAPSSANPNARRMKRAAQSAEKMTREGFPYQYRSARDERAAMGSHIGGADVRKPKVDEYGNVQRFYGEYMQVGDAFVPYNAEE